MNLAMPFYVLYSGTYKEGQSTTTRIFRAVHVEADIQNCRFAKTRHRVLWRPKCALSMLAIMLSDKYVAYGFAVRRKDEKATKGAREIHIIAFKTQSRSR
jgi:hypothetical protein